MLLKRPLDLVGTMPENRVVGERHPLTTESDKVFTLELGSFYSKSVVIRDVGTGNILKLGTDYHLLGYNDKASKQTGGKQVDTIVVIQRSDVAKVAVDYQAVGGVYSNLTLAFIDLLNQVKDTDRSKVDWMEHIINKPDSTLPTPHTHEIREISEIEDGVTALTKLLAAIYSLDTKNYRGVYDALYNKIRNVRTDLDTTLDFVNNELDLIISKTKYEPGDVIVGDFIENPVKWYPEVDWVLLPESFLYGNTYTSGTDPLSVDVKPGTGLMARTTHIYVAVPKGGARYMLERSKSSVNEGDSVLITLVTVGASPGSIIPYVITGIRQEDIQEPLTGNFILDNTLLGRLTINVIADFETEGDEIMRVSLVENPSVFTTVKINDTSKTPVFDSFFTSDYAGQTRITQINEGQTGYYQIRATDVPDGTELNLFYGGTASANDFSTPLPANARLNGLAFTMPVTAIEDQRTEGNETLLIKLSLSNEANAIVATSLTVIDTSKTQSWEMYYSSDAGGNDRIAAIGEGFEFYLHVIGNNVTNGTVIGLNYGGTANIYDLEQRYDNLTIMNGRASCMMKTRADFETEGDETLIITSIYNGKAVANSTLVILDTSASASSNLKFSSNSSGTNTILQVNEGETFYLVLTAVSNLPDGTVVNLLYEGTATDADFTRPRPSQATVLNQKAVVEYTLVNDQTDEGDETMRVRVINTTNNVQLGVEQITIKDTSRGVVYRVLYTGGQTSDTAISSINEGQTAWLTVLGTNVPNGKVLQVEQYIGGLLAITSNGDVDVNPPTTMVINNNRGSIPIQIRADMRTEGNEPLLGIVKDGAQEIGRKEITVIDTSITPTYAMWFSDTENGNMREDRLYAAASDFWLVLETTGVVPGTRVYLGAWEGSPGNLETTPDSVVVQGPRTSIKMRGKVLYNDGWSVGVYCFTDASRTQVVTSNWFNIDSTRPDIYFSSNAAGNNRVTVVNEDDVVYLHITFPRIGNGFIVPLAGAIKDAGPQASNGHVWEDVNEYPVTNNNRAYTVIKLKGDLTLTGDFIMYFLIQGNGTRADCTVRDTSVPPETVITVPMSYNNRYVRGKELFVALTGRQPNAGERIRIVVPDGLTLVGFPDVWAKKYRGAANWEAIYDTVHYPGADGLILNFDRTNFVTVDCYGVILSGPKRIYFENFSHTLPGYTSAGDTIVVGADGWDIFPHFDTYWAIRGPLNYNLIVRSTGKVLGHGGDCFYGGQGTQTEMGQAYFGWGNGSVYAGEKVVIRVDSGGVVQGGGGAGGTGGGFLKPGSTHNKLSTSAIIENNGGGGAPYGNRRYQFNGWSGDPVCPTKFTILGDETVRLVGNSNQYKRWRSATSTLQTPGGIGPRVTYNQGNFVWDFISGSGGAWGQPGQAAGNYSWKAQADIGGVYSYTADEMRRAGQPGQSGFQVTGIAEWNNSIA